jgi:hypothetical protein
VPISGHLANCDRWAQPQRQRRLGASESDSGGNDPEAIGFRLQETDLKGFLPSFEFMINTTLSSATKCTQFEIAHGLPARTIAQARIEAQHVGRGATDPEILEDVSAIFDGSAVKHILEKAIEIAEEVKAIRDYNSK